MCVDNQVITIQEKIENEAAQYFASLYECKGIGKLTDQRVRKLEIFT